MHRHTPARVLPHGDLRRPQRRRSGQTAIEKPRVELGHQRSRRPISDVPQTGDPCEAPACMNPRVRPIDPSPRTSRPSAVWHAVQVNLVSAPSWYSDPLLTGTFVDRARFTLVKPCTLGLSLAPTYTLALTDAAGHEVQQLGQTTQPLTLCVGQEQIRIPRSDACRSRRPAPEADHQRRGRSRRQPVAGQGLLPAGHELRRVDVHPVRAPVNAAPSTREPPCVDVMIR